MRCSDFTILVADDDLSQRKVYEKALSEEGYRLILVESCERALAELFEKEASLLITDLKMAYVDKRVIRDRVADMDGFEMFPLLMKNHPHLPVIVASGSYDRLMEDFPLKAFVNVKALFLKPLSMRVLKQKIREVLKIEDF